MLSIMGTTLTGRAPARFSETARSAPVARDAAGHLAERCGAGAVGGRRPADDGAERAPERAEAGEADVQADVAHAAVGLAQHEHRPLDAPPLEVAVRRLA